MAFSKTIKDFVHLNHTTLRRDRNIYFRALMLFLSFYNNLVLIADCNAVHSAI